MFRTVRTATLKIGYEESGPDDGAAVVLLHGWPSDPRDWDGVAPGLVAEGCRVLAPWLRGYGPTRFLHDDTPRSGQQAALGADLRDFMDGLSKRGQRAVEVEHAGDFAVLDWRHNQLRARSRIRLVPGPSAEPA